MKNEGLMTYKADSLKTTCISNFNKRSKKWNITKIYKNSQFLHQKSDFASDHPVFETIPNHQANC